MNINIFPNAWAGENEVFREKKELGSESSSIQFSFIHIASNHNTSHISRLFKGTIIIQIIVMNQNQEGRPSAPTSWGLRGQKRGDNKLHNNMPGIPAEREKHKLMAAIMSHVHGE